MMLPAAPGVYDPSETVLYFKYCITRLRFGPRTFTCLKHAEVLSFIAWLLLIQAVQLRRID